MNKNRQIISELQSFFKYNDASKAIKSITTVMNSLTIQSKVVGPIKNPNCKFTFVQVVKLLILFPFFSVKNAANYEDSGLGKLFSHTSMKSILGCVKRFEAYETIGGLFAEVTGETVELSVAQRIWGLIVEVINVIAEFIACDPFELIENAINNNNQIKAVKQAFDRLELAETAA